MTHPFDSSMGLRCGHLLRREAFGDEEPCARSEDHPVHAVDPEPTDATAALVAQRGAMYGGPVEGMARVAQAWSGVLGHEVTGHQVALCMAALKLVRANSSPDHQDHYDDARGYLAIAEQVVESWDQ